MCVRTLLDASAFGHFCVTSAKTAGHQFRCWITRGDGVVIYSADASYGAELAQARKIQALLSDFRQRGLAIRIDPERVETERRHIPPRPARRSNDPHVLAVAAAGDATVLFSCDGDLRDDFCELLPKVGRQERSSFPLRVDQPQDTTDANRRRKFLEKRKSVFRRVPESRGFSLDERWARAGLETSDREAARNTGKAARGRENEQREQRPVRRGSGASATSQLTQERFRRVPPGQATRQRPREPYSGGSRAPARPA